MIYIFNIKSVANEIKQSLCLYQNLINSLFRYQYRSPIKNIQELNQSKFNQGMHMNTSDITTCIEYGTFVW